MKDVAALYVRLSKQGETEESIDRQIEQGTAYATSHGFVPVVYREPKGLRSGYYEHRRPAWQQLNRDLEANPRIAVVVVADLARAHRHAVKTLAFVEKLQARQIEFVSLKEQIDPKTAAGRALLGVIAVFNQFYRDDISERKTRQYRARDSSIYASNVHPYGLTRTGKYPSIVWTTTPDFPVLLKLLELYADGVGAPTIATELDALGYTWLNRKLERSRINRSTVQRAINALERYRPFLSDDLYRRVLSMRESKRQHPRSVRQTKRQVLPLRGLLYCTACGKKFKSGTQYVKRSYGEYEYRYYFHPFTPCTATHRTRRSDLVEKLFWEHLEPFQRLADADKERIVQHLTQPPDQSAAVDVEQRRDKLTARLQNYEQMRADGDISLPRFREVKGEIENDLAQLPEAVPLPPSPMPPSLAHAVIDNLFHVLPFSAELDPQAANVALHTLIERIVYDGERITRVEWKEPFTILEQEFQRMAQ